MASKMTHAAHRERAAEIQRLRPTSTMDALSTQFGMTYAAITRICRGIAGPGGRAIVPLPKRDIHNVEALRERYRAGETLEQIGQSIGVSRERVRQIIQLSKQDGGMAVAAARNRAEGAQRKKLTMEYWRTEFRRRIRAAGWRKCSLCHCYGIAVEMGHRSGNSNPSLGHFGCIRQYQRLRTAAVAPSAKPGSRGWGDLTPEQRQQRAALAHFSKTGEMPRPEDPYYTSLVRYPASGKT